MHLFLVQQESGRSILAASCWGGFSTGVPAVLVQSPTVLHSGAFDEVMWPHLRCHLRNEVSLVGYAHVTLNQLEN